MSTIFDITARLVLTETVPSTDTRAIIGIVVAVVVLIVAGLFAFLWMRRRRRHPPELIDLCSDGPSPPPSPHMGYDSLLTETARTYDPYVGYGLTTNNSVRNDLTLSRSTELGSLTPLVPHHLGSQEVRRDPSSLGDGRDAVTPFTGISSSSNSSGTRSTEKTRLVLSNDTPNAAASRPQTGDLPARSRQDATPMLTDQQADFINSLHQNNVPAAAIARVVERLLADQHSGIREWERETRLARTNTMTTAPPSYDLVAERE